MKRLVIVLALVIGFQQWQIQDLYLDHADAGAYIDSVADMVGDCSGHDSCSEAINYLEQDIADLQEGRQ